MPEPMIPLPTDHAFVLQLQKSQGRPGACHAGRVEHLATGQATRFTTAAELWDFVDRVLTTLAEHCENEPNRERSER